MSDAKWRGMPAWYGWIIVIVAALVMVATLPGRTHGLGMITERLLNDERFAMDRVEYSQINLWATLIGGLFCLPCGWLIDRLGLRVTLTATVAALAATVLWMTHIQDRATLSFAILLTRGFGQSALSVISITMVGKWFPGRLSLPMAVYSLLLSVGFVQAALLAKPYGDADWRVVWNTIGYVLVVFTPIALIFTFEPPLAVAAPTEADERPSASPGGFTLVQAMSTQAFWLFGIAISLIALIGSGMSLFNESVLKQQGFDNKVYYDLIALTGTVGLIAKLPVGWLGRMVPLNRLLTLGMFLQAICMALLPYIHTKAEIAAYAWGMGISGTITTVLFFTIWGEAFGKAHLGRIQSISQMMTVLASALGPLMFAECLARYGSYAGVFQVLAALTAVIAVWSWFVRVPRPEDAAMLLSAGDAILTPEPV